MSKLDGKVLMVYGHARGGTSAMACVLLHLGVDMGHLDDIPNVYKNGEEYLSYEDMDYWQMHLGMRCRNRASPRKGDLWLLENYLKRRLEFAQMTGKPVGAKFPGCHLWQRVPGWERLPIAPVRMHRPIQEVAASNARKMPHKKVNWVLQAEQHEASMRAAVKKIPPVATVSYDGLVNRTPQTVKIVAQVLGLKPSPEALEAAINSVSRSKA